MTALLSTPFALLSIAIGIDEFYFHAKRGLLIWERISHPFDTLTVLICFSFLYFSPVTVGNLEIFGGIALFSCLSITKDEFVHAKECAPAELWLHSVLFILHPLMLVAAAFLWWENPEHQILGVQAVFAAVFLIYQLIRWPLKTKS